VLNLAIIVPHFARHVSLDVPQSALTFEGQAGKIQEQTNMRKQWVALLSVLGLTGPVPQSESQVLKGSTPNQAVTNETVKKNDIKQNPKLDLKQQTLRQQSPGSGKQADPLSPSAECNKAGANNQQLTKGAKANNQLTPPPPGGNNAITKGNNALTKGSSANKQGNKLNLNQQDLRQQNQAGAQAGTQTKTTVNNQAGTQTKTTVNNQTGKQATTTYNQDVTKAAGPK
jgi:hypothetical protein